MFDCPTCHTETRKLIAFTNPPRVGCAACGQPKKRNSLCNLGQTVDKFVGQDGKVHKITAGKNWEIGNRILSRDNGKTMINRVTGKPTEY